MSTTELSPELERALLLELHQSFEQLNYDHFKGSLRAPQLALTSQRSVLGRFLAETRTIEISRHLVIEHPWGAVVEVLKHEMAHQFVHDVLKSDEPPHGPVFQAVCKRLGIDQAAQGLPQVAAHRNDPVMRRVQRLLALAQSDNQHEAELAANTAAKLMLQHNLKCAAETSRRDYGFRHLGRITGRIAEWERRLANILSKHFFVDIIWVPAYRPLEAKRGSVLEAMGTAENLELAAYVYAFLTDTAERLWSAHQRKNAIRGRRERQSYLAGVMSGFCQKLDAQARVHKEAGLVWLPQADLIAYAKKRHPHVRSTRSRGTRQSDAFGEGQAAGRNLVLHRGLSQGASGETRRLPART